MLPLFLSPRGDSGPGDTSRGRAGSLIAGRCCLSGPPHRQTPAGGYHLPTGGFQEHRCKQPGTMARLAAGRGPAGTDRSGDMHGWGTRMIRVMHRQVTHVARGCSHLGTHVASGHV